jgi:hypothetical protein
MSAPASDRLPSSDALHVSDSMSPSDKTTSDNVDAVLDRLLKVLPELPYILSIESNLPFDRDRQDYEQRYWAKNYPFRPSELRLQYLSYLFRDNTDSCFVIRTEVDEDRERRAREGAKSKGFLTASGTPGTTAAKKKISFSAYKSKVAAGGAQSGMAHESLPEDRTNGREESRHGQQKGEKRKSPGTTSLDSPVPAKKLKAQSPVPKSKDHGLPPLLSPTLPYTSFELPEMLSPTLPANLEIAVKKIEKQWRRENQVSDHSSPSAGVFKRRLDKKAEDAGSDPQPNKVSKRRKSVEPSPSPPPEPDGRQKMSLIVKIRYSRTRRKDVERILRREPDKRRWATTDKHGRQGADADDEGSEIEVFPRANSKSREVHGGIKDKAHLAAPFKPMAKSTGPAKSSKGDGDGSTVTTPAAPATLQNGVRRAAAASVTPKQQTSVNMARQESNESMFSTPKDQTPFGSKGIRPSESLQAQYREQMNKWNALGRSLKHKFDGINVSSEADRSTKAIVCIESIMAYIMAYALNDARTRASGRLSDFGSPWTTLFQLASNASTATRHFQDLDGLRNYLTAIVYGRAVKGISQRLRNSEISRVEVDAEERKTVLAALKKNDLERYYEQMNKCSYEAERKLSVFSLMKNYPTTAAIAEQSAKDAGKKEDLLETGGLSGGFSFPPRCDVEPQEGVRFGLAVLREWITKHSLQYEIAVAKGPS